MTYDEAIAFWFGRINYEVRSARPGDLKLERMRALLRRLGQPHDQLRLVHVTGTKGKGSTSAMLAAILQAAGYRVGLFTSPHLTHVEERMQVNGVPISRAELTALMEEVAPAVRAMEAETDFPSPTFFEIGTALGFLHFLRRRCDIAVIEVGLGGRFDSTNVCRPLVSVITNVGFDHTAQLGNTLEAIAYQKGGIIKPRVPVVCGVSQEGPREVIRQIAASMNAPLIWVPPALASPTLRPQEGHDPLSRPGLPHGEQVADIPRGLTTNLLGQHQVHNAALAVAAIQCLRDTGMPITDDAVRRGLNQVKWPARIEHVADRPTIILDTAHNVPSAEALVGTLRECFPAAAAKRVVFAVSSDKPVAEILRVLAGYFDHFHFTKYASNPRSVPPDKLATFLAEVAPGKPCAVHPTAIEAWMAARASVANTDLVCITGSVFLAGELRPHLVAPA
ncbi:MAG: folylpolyglutamate synthase/dihydrofolate synthase family protein [Gemmataceae bacterium]|nr:bifunctional folylpolyglutamate synthase/dihydrofolate synthase [Gemmata sp.]MDW8198086.1 folylpolyglutamate synthase/dihydrofolate synthase family protein [Gemmataceae bacterium]